MGQLRSAVRAYAAEGHDPAAVLTSASDLLTQLESDLLATCCLVYLHTTSGTARIALAGHPAPLLRYPDGRIETLDETIGVPLGLAVPHQYEQFEVHVPPGALLALYTDGLAGAHDDEDVVAKARRLVDSGTQDGVDIENLADHIVARVPAAPDRRDDVALLLALYEGEGRRRRLGRLTIHRHDLHGVRDTRRWLRAVLTDWGWADAVENAELMVSEIVTNALIHADSAVAISLREREDHIHVEVEDWDVSPPIPSGLSAEEGESETRETGRGLLIVAALGDWGVYRRPHGKAVWINIYPENAHVADAGPGMPDGFEGVSGGS
jgi:anti-sigma regulatory factor (Ser/Thr protein kinase)